jgi:hypothetical protein
LSLGTVGGFAGSGLAFGGDLLVERVESLGLGAVEVEPPVADEVVLVAASQNFFPIHSQPPKIS